MENIFAALWLLTKQEHFVPALVLPMVASFYCFLTAKQSLRQNVHCLAIALVLAWLQTLPIIQSGIRMIYPSPAELHVFPLYPAVYLLIARFDKASLRELYLGTFICGLAADLIWSIPQPCCESILWIGGGGINDGLVTQPLRAVLIGWLANRTSLFPVFKISWEVPASPQASREI